MIEILRRSFRHFLRNFCRFLRSFSGFLRSLSNNWFIYFGYFGLLWSTWRFRSWLIDEFRNAVQLVYDSYFKFISLKIKSQKDIIKSDILEKNQWFVTIKLIFLIKYYSLHILFWLFLLFLASVFKIICFIQNIIYSLITQKYG